MWTTPKTNWSARYNDNGEYIGDFLNISDYERICNNLGHLKDLFKTYNKPNINFETFVTLTVQSLAHAKEWNIIENNLDELINHFGGLDELKGNKKSYSDNGIVIDYSELNRIESVSLSLKETAEVEYINQKQLEYSLGLDNIGIFSTRGGV